MAMMKLYPQRLSIRIAVRMNAMVCHYCRCDRLRKTVIPTIHTGLPLASSIHTIHRPIARMKRQDTNSSLRASNGKGKAVVTLSPTPSSDEDDGDVSSDEDFETTPVDPQQPPFPLLEEKEEGPSKNTPPTSPTESMVARLALTRRLMSRSASLATVKIKRRAKLASKLKDVFSLPEINEVVAGKSHSLVRRLI